MIARKTNGKPQMETVLSKPRQSRSLLTITVDILAWIPVLFRLNILSRTSRKVQTNQHTDGGTTHKKTKSIELVQLTTINLSGISIKKVCLQPVRDLAQITEDLKVNQCQQV